MSTKKLAAEFLGTFCLVFAGTGAIIANDVSGGAVSHVGIALTFGLVVMAMIYAMGDVSGAHLNPAVTLGFCAAHRLSQREALPFIAAQCAGGMSASLVLRLLFSAHATLGGTRPLGSGLHASAQAFVFEFILTSILMFVVLSVSTGAKEKGITAGIAVGGVIALEALFAGPISGASMNPARSLAPAVATLHWAGLWIYLLAPVLGALGGVAACRCVREAGCCTAAATLVETA